MSFAVGSLVRARGREWVVLPDSDDDLVMVRPLGGTDAEVTGILSALEDVRAATFDLPDPARSGDHRSARLLRDALRLGFRSSAGPFRSFGHIAVEPRPYQLVPLLMALKLDPVRLLIADDVGIGKTVESALVARELLDQGDASRLAVLCPPHLAEQWQAELVDKFNIEAELVLSSTAGRLERALPSTRTIFEAHPFVIVSTDYIKADRRREDFLRTCPEQVIVDEAHACVSDGTAGRHQRHELVAGLARDPSRHLILVTATPHSGKEGAFRALLALLEPAFANLGESGDDGALREQLAAHLVQRRRADIRVYLDSDTAFPTRLEREVTYRLTAKYRNLFDRVLAYARETVRDPAGGEHRQRVRWWSALALLQALASSPAAAAETLRTRASTADTATVAEADEIGRRTLFDLTEDDEDESPDVVPGADPGEGEGAAGGRARRRLRELAREADELSGDADPKLVQAATLIGRLLNDGASPIVFCRYIATAEYLAEELRRRLARNVEIAAVTGSLPPAERQARISELGEHPRRVLVATDCLSEGVNLQDRFDAVVHYDLPWNPTRLEQREGRVDRFGQVEPEVRVVTYYCEDNQVDRIVLEVLLRKHRAIRNALGISIPIPGNTGAVLEAVTEGVLLARDGGGIAEALPGIDEHLRPVTQQLDTAWQDAADREQVSRTRFAQRGIRVDEVAQELEAVRDAVGSATVVESFVRTAVAAHGGRISPGPNRGSWSIDAGETPIALRDAVTPTVGGRTTVSARFELPVRSGERYLGRTAPFVGALAGYILDAALDPATPAVAARCGLVRTDAVASRTTLVLVRFRFHLVTVRSGEEHPLLAEDAAVLAFAGPPEEPAWLAPEQVEQLLAAEPTANSSPAEAADFVGEMVGSFTAWAPHLHDEAARRAEALRDAHTRVRDAARHKGVRYRVEPQLPPDVLGIYVLLPGPTMRTKGA